VETGRKSRNAAEKQSRGTVSHRINHGHNNRSTQTWIQDLLIQDQDQDQDSAVSRPRQDQDSAVPRPRPRPRLVKTDLETSRDQDSSLENSKSGSTYVEILSE